MTGHFKLQEVFAASQLRFIPSTLRTVEDVALASWNEIPVKKSYEYISAAQSFLAKKLLRSIKRENDSIKVTLINKVDYTQKDSIKLFQRISALFSKLYQEDKLMFKGSSELEYVYVLQNLSDYDKQTLDKFSEVTFDEPTAEQALEKADQIEIPADIFESILSYEDIKNTVKKSLKTERPVHILFVGPPASAKTLFLLEMERIFGDRARYALGGGTTKSGLSEILLTEKPEFLLIDELDKMNAEDYSVLLSLCESGIVAETKYGKTRRDQLSTRVYAAANRDDKIPLEVLSRFRKFHLKRYSPDEFREVVVNILTKNEKTSLDLASYIAQKLVSNFRNPDVREAIRIARLNHSKEEVDADIRTILEHHGDKFV